MPNESSTNQRLTNDRRQTTANIDIECIATEHCKIDLFTRLSRGFKLQDILSARHHSNDFIETRSEYIAIRVRFMAFFYAIAVPLWIPMDYLLLNAEHFSTMIIPKLLLMAVLFPLGKVTLRKLSNTKLHIVFALTILAACLFYFASMMILNHGIAEPLLAGYSFMPFMFVSMLGVFPLTINWSLGLIFMIMLTYLGLQAALGQLLSMDTANMLWMFIILSGIALWVQSSQLLILLKLYRESSRDPLTGVINRRVLMKCLTSEIEHAKAGGYAFSILMFDLDRFKRINDSYGHLTGDKVLKTTADILQKGIRENDIVARFGGEEFVAVLTDCHYQEAITVAERIRASCYEALVTAPNDDKIQLSTSVGVTEYEPGEDIVVTLNRADESLYQAKEQGRNRVIHSQSNSFTGTDDVEQVENRSIDPKLHY